MSLLTIMSAALAGLACYVVPAAGGSASLRGRRVLPAPRDPAAFAERAARGRRGPGCCTPDVAAEIVDLVAAAVDAGAAPASACRCVATALRDTAPGDSSSGESGDMSSGHTTGFGPGARNPVADDLDRLASNLAPRSPALLDLFDVLDRAARTGVAPALLLRRLAEEERRQEQSAALEQLGRLPVLLVLPAGLCLLPAAMLLGVVPVILDLLSSVLR